MIWSKGSKTLEPFSCSDGSSKVSSVGVVCDIVGGGGSGGDGGGPKAAKALDIVTDTGG